ncbi:MAG TPA: ParB/RepB/Spo0J family partition protein [Dokdonella sp.]|uniref:ParB/RepB/Spo0J family partition protein n=1 Tax=Dokdonella sp. TaxID=2291710 RepID=UPI002C3D481F|nr:ParB/RepB/Spo0J family partition protein [Dokdonella sp.]HUD41371.1 ParB/RepB/Spo0J family partition protein [Dokdonella sp.]
MAAKKRGLGRGLDVLLGGGETALAESEGELRTLATASIQPGKYQPRQTIDPERLEELAASIKAQGLIQPVVVRAIAPGRYELIAGERRWRAAQKAGMTEVPALVKEVPDQAVVAMALIENIQREDLSPLEESQALARLIEEFDLTHQQAADAVGRSRAAVSNLLRLLELPAEIRALLDARKLDMGHARALGTLPPPQAVALARQAAENGWSVRELEEAVRRASEPIKTLSAASPVRRDANIESLERELAEKLATRVALSHGRGGRGKIVIHYHSLDELDGILEKIR